MVVDPNDPDSRSAGSFFTNPIVDGDFAERLARTWPTLPRWAMGNERTKLSAAWLIEQAGFAKGTTRGAVGLSTKHALALIHRGGGTTRDLLAFAREIQDGVRARFGVSLEPEPVIVGVD
jgi:UDP-N-acetylmuramate dehydrogenase